MLKLSGDKEIYGVCGEMGMLAPYNIPSGSEIVKASPFDGGERALENGKECEGKVVVFKRGGCNFVDKGIKAQEMGAKAAVVVQNVGIWP